MLTIDDILLRTDVLKDCVRDSDGYRRMHHRRILKLGFELLLEIADRIRLEEAEGRDATILKDISNTVDGLLTDQQRFTDTNPKELQ